MLPYIRCHPSVPFSKLIRPAGTRGERFGDREGFGEGFGDDEVRDGVGDGVEGGGRLLVGGRRARLVPPAAWRGAAVRVAPAGDEGELDADRVPVGPGGNCCASEASGWCEPGWLKTRLSPAALAARVKAMATV